MSHRLRPDHLWREVLGMALRERRRAFGRTLAQVAGRAGVSVQYLSEIERGLKDPSSEVISAIAGALEISLVDLTHRVGDLAGAGSSRRVALELRSSTRRVRAARVETTPEPGRAQLELLQRVA